MNDKKKLKLISQACLIELFNNDTVQFLARKNVSPVIFTTK